MVLILHKSPHFPLKRQLGKDGATKGGRIGGARREYQNIQGDPKKMLHKDSWLKSVLEVRFYFSAGALEPEN